LKILVCGATGFIGRNIVEALAKVDGYQVTAIYNKRSPFVLKGVEFIQADLTLYSDVQRIIKPYDIIIQAAANTTGVKDVVERPYVHVTDNAIMNSLLLRACYENHVKKFIFFSCTVMYQTKSEPYVKEMLVETDFNPAEEIVSGYFGVGWTKVYIEKMCEFYSRLGRTNHYVLRHSNIYGPYDKFDLENSHVFGATINKVLDGESDEISIWGDGEELRDLLYISDLVDAVRKIIELKSDCAFSLLNIGSGCAVSVKALTETIMKISNNKKKMLFDHSKPTMNTSVSLDCSLAKNILGWVPKVTLEVGIRKTINWYFQHNLKV